MVTYKEAGKMLDKAMEALPQGIFEGLNGGVNLIEEAKSDGRGGYIMGLYHNNMMGRYIEIFYGSFLELYGDIPPMQFEKRLRSTLHHELTHHIEGLAGDRSLEHWDEDQDFLWAGMEEEPLIVGSVLFADDDDCALAPAAKAFWQMYSAERCADIPAESAGIFSSGETLHPDCLKAAEEKGAFYRAHSPKALTRELFDSYDAIMCMTLAQADELMERFPGCESKILCIDERDILRPRMKLGWKQAIERLRAAIDTETELLRAPSAEGIEIIPLGEDCPEHISAAIAALEEKEFSAPWTEDMLRRAFADENKLFFAAMDGELCAGYIGSQLIFEELEIFNVATDEAYRGRGIAKALAGKLIDEAKEKGAQRITLEVRESNAPAIGLYEKLGFAEVGRRKNYYQKPREDAILMDLNLI